MLIIGAAALIVSVIYASTILAFIGLGLTFWGAILLYIRDQEYTLRTLLDASSLPSLTIISQVIQELNYKGNAVYLPPKYFENPEITRIYISKQETTPLPKPEQIQKNRGRLLVRTPEGVLGVLLTPPAIELTKLFEKTLKANFTKIGLERLMHDLPKLFVEDLEIAEDLEVQTVNGTASSIGTKKNVIQVKITNSTYRDMHNEAKKLPFIRDHIGCPICSAIACAIAKALDKPVMIEKTQESKDSKIIETQYRIVEE